MISKRIILLILSTIINSTSILAYIDPGTGGMIAGSVWPFVVGILATIGAFFSKSLFRPIKKMFFKLNKKKIIQKEPLSEELNKYINQIDIDKDLLNKYLDLYSFALKFGIKKGIDIYRYPEYVSSIKYLNATSSDKILDVGCGDTLFPTYLLSKINAEIHCIDLDNEKVLRQINYLNGIGKKELLNKQFFFGLLPKIFSVAYGDRKSDFSTSTFPKFSLGGTSPPAPPPCTTTLRGNSAQRG